MNASDVHISKLLSLVLRHRPQTIGLTLDPHGWIDVESLLLALNTHGHPVSRERLESIVATNDKQRFAFHETADRIRAVQGHSLAVAMEYPVITPPDRLYHGTARRFLESIRCDGLERRARQFVHLSQEVDTAAAVGRRYGAPVVLIVDAAAMTADGHCFHRADNGVWLTAAVPPRYLDFEADVPTD